MTTTDHLCVVCHVFGLKPIAYEHAYVDFGCRARIKRYLIDIPDQHDILDPTPGGGSSERVSGSKEAPIGARVDVLDQQLPLSIYAAEPIRVNVSDQVGAAPAVVLLDAIVSEWLEVRRERGLKEHRPVPTVANLCAWLADRLDWACERLPDSIDDHALELKGLVGRLYTLNGSTRSREAEPVPATPCKQCGQIALVRFEGSVICTNCSQYSGPFHEQLTQAIAEAAQAA